MSLNIENMKSALIGGGARANYFEVELPVLAAGLNGNDQFLVKGSSLPSSVIAPITIPFRGRQLQIVGDRTFEPWNVTVVNDVDMKIRKSIEDWMERLNALGTNTSELQEPSLYMSDGTVYQLDRQGNKQTGYKFIGVWPSNISAIDLSYDSENTIEEFTVEFQVTSFARI